MWKHTTSESWAFMPATGLSNGSVVDALLQFVPNYNFVDGHYYDISITCQHSYSDWTVDRIQFLTNGNSTVITDSSNFSYTFNVIDRYNFVLNLKGVRDIDAARVLQRIRFYAEVVGWNDPSSPGTPQTTIAIGTVVLDINDSTDKYVLPQIEDTLEDSNQTQHGILDFLTDLPDTLFHLVVPTEQQFNSAFNSFKTSVEGKLGFVSQLNTLLNSFISKINSSLSNPTHVIDVPDAEFDIPPDTTITLWKNASLDLWPFANYDAGLTVLRVLIGFVFIMIFYQYIDYLIYRIFGNGGDSE